MATEKAKRINTFIQHRAPSLYQLIEQHPQLEAYLQESWLWVRSQRAQAVRDLGSSDNATPALRREAKRCATEISLSLLQYELQQMLTEPPAKKSFA